jgi:long-chain acyl-CoA synthetase
MLYQALVKIAQKRPDKVAVTGEARSLTFGAMLGEVREIARQLQILGIEPGQTILLGVPPSPDFYSFFYAACALGATVIPLLPSDKIPAAAVEANPVIAVGGAAFVKAVRAACPGPPRSISWDRNTGFDLGQGSTKPPLRRPQVIREHGILAILSSGTTGEPTLHRTSAEALLRHGQLRAKVIGIRTDDVILSTRPFNNMSSLDAPVILPVVTGCRVVVHEKFQRYQAAEAIARELVSVIYAVPIIFEMLAGIPDNYPGDFSSLRLCVSGGAPLPQYVYDKFKRRFGIAIRQRYGSTQFFPAFNYDTRGVPGAVGQLSGPFPMTVIGETGRPLRSGQIGEIVLDCAKLSGTLWRDCFKGHPDRMRRYLHTGDLGRFDDQGTLFIVGRKSPFIKVGGNRVAPAEVESVLRSHPKVRDSIVIAYHQGKHDEAVQAIVVPSQGLTERELLAYCSERLAAYKCPRRLEFRAALPRNAQGKIIRHQFQPQT